MEQNKSYNKEYGIFAISDRLTSPLNRSLIPVILSLYDVIETANGGIVIADNQEIDSLCIN